MKRLALITILVLLVSTGSAFAISPDEEPLKVKGFDLTLMGHAQLVSTISAYATSISVLFASQGVGTTIYDEGVNGYDMTLTNQTVQEDQTHKGLLRALIYDGATSEAHGIVSDAAELSFGTGAEDEPMTIIAIANIQSGLGSQAIICKWDATAAAEVREYRFTTFSSTRVLYFEVYDETNDEAASAVTASALSAGWHLIVLNYDGTAGATAMNGVTIYVDGESVSVTPTNNASYVAMSDTGADVYVGVQQGTAANVISEFENEISVVGLDAGDWTSDDVWMLWKAVQGVLGL